MPNNITIQGARVHNLKNINVSIPRDKLVVITGISGSGKSTLAFDTIYAEGQRRYVESLSSYAKQFLGLMDKPDVDSIDGLSPAISIDQRSAAVNPRSTVGTVTEIYDYLRLLYSRIGRVHCPQCGQEVHKLTPTQIIDQIYQIVKKSQEVMILSPLQIEKSEKLMSTLIEIQKAGFRQVRINNKIYSLDEAKNIVQQGKNSDLEIVITTFTQTANKVQKDDLSRSIELALELGNGQLVITSTGQKDLFFSLHFNCPKCSISLPSLEARNFSFNSPAGACPKCLGLGTKLEIDPELLIPNKRLTLAQGAIKPWTRNFSNQTVYWKILEAVAKENKFSLNSPVEKLSDENLKLILYGTGSKVYAVNGDMIFEGVIPLLEQKYQETNSDYLHKEIEQYMRISTCPTCKGKRLKKEILSVTVGGLNISEITELNIDKTEKFFKVLANNKSSNSNFFNISKEELLVEREKKIADSIFKEVLTRLQYLQKVGLNYLTLSRPSATLAGGEAQRIRLATQIGLSLTGVIYILDEPSIGLHQRDNMKLIETLQNLRNLGNSVIVVEHDSMTILAADEVIDIGPGAGEYGGKIVAQGSPSKVMKQKNSLTGQYLSGSKQISPPKNYRKGSGKFLEVIGAEEFNLKNINVKIPLGKLACLTGVSGSGKSTLMLDILARALSKHFYRSKDLPGKHKEIKGVEHIDKVISIDQSPIGRTPRSNPATYTGVFTYIRDLFTQTPEAKIRGYNVGKFSFNARGGRCETCTGEGFVKIEMQFLPDVYVPCEECLGKRYKKEVLEIRYKGNNIADVLDMPVEEAMDFFRQTPIIYDKLKTLFDVGLGYIHLGQSATTLSGGEAQRVKLATELSRRATGKTLYILDEPTTGLHFEDIKRLLQVLNQLVDKGNTVLIIEHNLDIIKCADWVIDLGPEGGDEGGQIIVQGTPKDIIKAKNSYTGQYLKEVLK